MILFAVRETSPIQVRRRRRRRRRRKVYSTYPRLFFRFKFSLWVFFTPIFLYYQ